MKIIDLSQEYEKLYFVCLEDWSDEMKESGCHKEHWYRTMKEKDLRVKLALNDEDEAVGMIEYLPIEHSIAEGHDLYYINCIWVHGHKQGIGDQRKHGYGKALLQAAEADAKENGAHGMAAHGITMPFWIPASYYRKQGYQTVDKNGMMRLLFKPFTSQAQPPVMIKPVQKPKMNENPGKVTLTYLLTGSCPGCNIVYERAKRAVEEYQGQVVLQTVDTSDRETYLKWGAQNELYLEDRQITNGPPLSYAKLKKLIQKQLRKL